MGYARWLPEVLGRWLEVETYAGWDSRGSSSFNPGGVVCHWTAGPCNAPAGARPSLGVVVNGREGLSGPLANVYLDRAGIAVVVAAGRANHAGEGGWHGLSGNSSVLGIEAECCRDGDWTGAQRDAYPRLVAGLLEGIGRDASWACGHNEWAPSRKIDIRDWPMPSMRETVGRLLSGEEEDVTPEQDQIIRSTLAAAQAAQAAAQAASVAASQAAQAATQAVAAADAATAQARQATVEAMAAAAHATDAAREAHDAASSGSDALYAVSGGRVLQSGRSQRLTLEELDEELPYLGAAIIPAPPRGKR